MNTSPGYSGQPSVLVLYTELGTGPNHALSFDRGLKRIPERLQGDILKYIQIRDRWLHLAGKLLLIECLNYFGLPLSLLDLKSSDNGKPFFSSHGLHFNISHSHDFCVCGATLNCGDIGVDIEKVIPAFLPDFEHYLSPATMMSIYKACNPAAKFFEVWTALESAIKADGRGLSLNMGDLEYNNLNNSVNIEKTIWYLHAIDIAELYVCHLASKIKLPQIKVVFCKI